MADILKNFKVNGIEHTLDYETGLSNKPTIPTTVEELSDSGNYVKLENGLVPNNVLPSYVDDVLEYANFASFPATGEIGKIYVDIETNFTYRWSGSTYIQIGGKDTADLEIALENLESELNELQENQFSGSYNDLTDKPTIPTKSSWNYDDRYVKYNVTQSLTETQKGTARSNIGAGTSNFSGSYEDLRDKPTIPTQTSQLTNNSGFITDNALTPYALNSNLTSEVDRLDARINAITGGGEGDDIPTLDNVYTQTQVNNLLANKVDKTITVNGHALRGNVTVTKSDVSLGNVTNDAQVKRSEMGVANGVATLGTDGKVPSAQLPSYVDDVLEYSSKSVFPTSGESGKIYIDTSNNKTYRWSGSTYVEISSSLALGETSSTAYAGNKGATNASNITKIINGTTTVGKATQATKVGTDTIGDTNTPIYLNAGVPTKLGFTIAKSVPSDAKFTDTTYSTATSSTAGLVKIGYSASGKNYAVQLNSAGQMYVNVPWENTQGSDTGATSITTTGSGNAVTSASYDSSTRKITLTKGTSFLPLSGGTVSGSITTSGDLITKQYIKINAWTGYGSGSADFWYDGNNKFVEIRNATNLKLAGSSVATQSWVSSNYLAINGNAVSATKATQDGSGNVITSTYLPKTTYEWNKEVAFGETGLLYIGAFPMYDSNITVDIDSTTSTTYHATLVIATQNINTTGGGSLTATVYGDATNTIAPNIYIAYVSGSNNIRVYFQPQSYSKNLIHIRCVALASAPTNICSTISSLPSDATRKPTNALLSNFVPLSGNSNITGSKTFDNITMSSSGGLVTEGVLQIKNGITALSSSTSTTYSKGSAGQVLKTNGTNVYWASDSNNTTYAASGDTSSKIFLIGRTSQSTSGGITYSHDTVYVDTSGRICGTAGVYTNKVYIPTASGGSTYGLGSAGQVLTSNGSTVYWSTPSSSSSTSQYITIDTNKVVIGADSTASTYGTAVGDNATASGSYATAIGRLTEATGSHSIAIGEAYSYGNYGIAIGESETYVNSSVHGGIAIGEYAQVNGNMSIAIGSMGSDGDSDYECVASKPYTVSIGNGSRAKADYGISIGRLSSVKGNYGIALGNLSSVVNAGGIAIGNGTSATYGVSLGNRAKSSGSYSTAIGIDASALGNYSIAIGYNVSVPAGNAIIKIGGSSYNSYYYSGTSTSWTASSDIRDKINITDMSNCQKIIDAINPIYYNYNRRRDYSENSSLLDYNIDEHIKGTKAEERITLGFRAQDVAKVMEELYGDECFGNIVVHDYEKNEETGKENDAYFMNNGELIPILVGALKEQKVVIDNLMERIKKIEEKLNIE